MTVIRPNSISGITSITSHQNDVAFYKSDGTGANINNISIHSPSGIITAASIDIGSDIKLGNSGVVTATSYRGDGSQLTGITGTTINNNAANRIITGEGGATLNGEANLTFDGATLAINSTTGFGLPKGTSAQEPSSSSGTAGYLRYSNDVVYYNDGTSWKKIAPAFPVLSSVSGTIIAGASSTLTLTGSGFLTANLVVNFIQTSDSIDITATVTPSSDTEHSSSTSISL